MTAVDELSNGMKKPCKKLLHESMGQNVGFTSHKHQQTNNCPTAHFTNTTHATSNCKCNKQLQHYMQGDMQQAAFVTHNIKISMHMGRHKTQSVTFVFGFIAAAQVSGLSASTLVQVMPHSGKSSVHRTSVAPYSDVWTSMWSPALMSVSMVVLIAVIPLAVSMAASVFSRAATLAARACDMYHNCSVCSRSAKMV